MDTKENKGRKVMAEMIKKKNAVMLADTRPALVGQMLVQLSVTNRHTFDEVIIFDTGICDNDKALMNAVMPCRFIPYESPLDQSFWEHERFQHFSMLMFARYEMFRLIREYGVIVWMDTDMVIQGTLQQLLELTSGYGFSILREDKQNKSADHEDRMRTNFFNPVPGYDMESYLYCTGLIVVRDSLEQKCDYTKWCYDKTMEWADNLNLPDQGVINALIQEFQFPVKALGQHGTYGCFPSIGRSCENAVLVHSWGSNKFWSDYYLNHKFPFWEECYQKWIDMGGSRLERSDIPEVSVVIPVYKPDLTYLKQCISSLLTQKRNSYEAYSNFEVILIAEPFEQEKIEALLQSFQDLRIRLFFNEKREGIAYSLNRGLELAQGKYIARMDDDDVAQEHRLWKQVTYLNEREEIEMCVSDYEYMGDMAEGRRIFEGEMSRAWSLLTCPFDHPTVMFRKSFFDKRDLRYDEKQKYAEDWELWLRAFEKGMTVGCIHEVLLYHRWHNGSAGQTEASSRRMKEIVQDNFRRLGVEIPEELVSVFCPWWGKVQNNEALVFLKESFAKALEENKRLGLYDQECLNRVFELRLAEAQTGVLPGLSWSAGKQEEEIAGELRDRMKKPGILRRILKRMLKPLYQPFRHRYEDRILELQTAVWRNEGHIWDCIAKLDKIQEILTAGQQSELEQMQETLEIMQSQMTEASKQLQEISMQTFALNSKLQEQTQVMSEKVYEQTENTRLLLSGKIYEHTKYFENDLRYIREIQSFGKMISKKIVLIGTAEHSNIGDAAIALGEIEFIRNYFPGYDFVELSKYDYEKWFSRIAELIGEQDIIFLHGGGNMGNRYIEEELLRRDVIMNFPNNKIVVFPQTISFDVDEKGQKELGLSAEIYNRHQNLMIFTRGRQSLQTACRFFPNIKSFDTIDMALLLKANYKFQRAGVLLCLREREDEGRFSKEQQQQIEEMVQKKNLAYDKTTNWNNEDRESNIYKDTRRITVFSQLRNYAKRRVVITDRLHGFIFSVLTKTPCIVLSASDHKIDEFYEYFVRSNAVFFCGKEIEAVGQMVDQALQVREAKYPVLEEEFQHMAEHIWECLKEA